MILWSFWDRTLVNTLSTASAVLFFLEVSSITKKLTLKQQRFVDEYIISGNATQMELGGDSHDWKIV